MMMDRVSSGVKNSAHLDTYRIKLYTRFVVSDATI